MINKLNIQFNLKLTDKMSLSEVCDILDSESVPYYYMSYNDEDIIGIAQEEDEKVDIYEIAGGYLGFQEGIIWN